MVKPAPARTLPVAASVLVTLSFQVTTEHCAVSVVLVELSLVEVATLSHWPAGDALSEAPLVVPPRVGFAG